MRRQLLEEINSVFTPEQKERLRSKSDHDDDDAMIEAPLGKLRFLRAVLLVRQECFMA